MRTVLIIKEAWSNMYVCNCRAVTDQDIRQAVAEGATSLGAVRQCTGVAGQCGKCAPEAKALIQETIEEIQFFDAMGAA